MAWLLIYKTKCFGIPNALLNLTEGFLNNIYHRVILIVSHKYGICPICTLTISRSINGQSFPCENHCKCYNKLASSLRSKLLTLTYFFLTFFLLFCCKLNSCCECCFPQQNRPQTTVQWYILRNCSSVRIGLNIINKRHTLPVCTIHYVS